MGPRASTEHLAVTIALVLALFMLVLAGAPSNAQTLPPEVDFEPGEIIVKLVDGVAIEAINTDYGTRVKDTFPDKFPDGENIYLLKVVDGGQSAEDVLEEMLDNKSPRERRTAANSVISHALKLREIVSLDSRVTALERRSYELRTKS